jgi:cbb3-type cytochrome oxidase subunit 1
MVTLPMRRIDLPFMLLAAASLLVGVCLGIWMGLSHDFAFAPVHAHLNLLGWASLALFGLTYRAWPELTASRLAAFHFAVSALGAVLFPMGIAISLVGGGVAVATAGALLWLAGVLAFLAGLARLAVAPALRAAPAE